MNRIVAEIEQGVISLVSAAVALGILSDDAVIPHQYQHLAAVFAGLIMYIAYRTPPPGMNITIPNIPASNTVISHVDNPHS